MNLKTNVNKLHSDLTSAYEDVRIIEGSNRDLGNFVQFSIIENNKQLVLNIKKYELEKENFNWSYLSNPEDTNSIVERNSNLESFIIDIKDIFNKNRFDQDYLKKLD